MSSEDIGEPSIGHLSDKKIVSTFTQGYKYHKSISLIFIN